MPPRLGELLIKAGELTAPQIEQALRAQVMWGGRLGTNLVELGYIDLDKLATALGKQRAMPAALGRHFDKSDPAVQGRLAADLAERYKCVPIMLAGPQRSQLIVASIEPLDKRAVAIIADDMRWDPEKIVVSIAGELRIRYHLEKVYNIARGTRFLRSKGKTIPPFPQLEIDPLAFEDSQVDNPAEPVTAPLPPPPPEPEPEAEPDDEDAFADVRSELQARLVNKAAEKARQTIPPPIAMPPADEPMFAPDDVEQLESIFDDEDGGIPERVDTETEGSSGRERRRYVETLDATPRNLDPGQAVEGEVSLGRISIKRVPRAVTVDEEIDVPSQMGLTLGEATRAIRRSTDRNRVAELVSETLFRFMLSCDAALLLVIRGDAAMSWKGFSRAGGTLPEIAMPLDQPGMIPRVIERCATMRSPSSDLSPIDQLLLVSLGAKAGDLVIVPVSIANQVMCVIALAGAKDCSPATAESVAAAAGAAFARLMRNASR